MAGGTKRSPLKGCLLGCGCLVVLAVLGVGGWIGSTVIKARGASASRVALDAAFPGQEQYVPPLQDTISPDRVARLLAVRERLATACERFRSTRAAFDEMEARAEKIDHSGKDPGVSQILDVLSGAGGFVGEAAGLAGDIADYETTRNRALLEQGMGLGEATWIGAAADCGLLGHEPVFVIPGDHGRGNRGFRRRLNVLVGGMISRHVDALQAAAQAAAPDERHTLDARIATWTAERDALAADSDRLPFQDGLPPELAASLEPFRADLERTWCEATSGLDLMRTSNHGLRVSTR